MATKTKRDYAAEREAIVMLHDEYFPSSSRNLTDVVRRIQNPDVWSYSVNIKRARLAAKRTFYSVLSVIRRHRAKQNVI